MAAKSLAPDWSEAVVPDAKITEYLLTPDHPKGGSKAALFVACGYAHKDPERLAADLATCARSNESREAVSDQYGTRYVVVGEMQTPAARS